MPILKNNSILQDLIRRCRESDDTNKRIELLQSIVRLLPIGYEIKIPSFVTNDYIDKVMYTLEEKIISYL